MTVGRLAARRGSVPALVVCLACTLSGCTWQSYAATRGIRFVTGGRTQLHPIVPVAATLRPYRVIEMPSLENLLPERMPSDLERYLNDVLAGQLHLVASSPTIVRRDPGLGSGDTRAPLAPDVPTLVFEGFIDDYDPGYVGLRLVELGFNHMVVTVRFELRDKQTGRVVGAASITVQDNRVTATMRSAIGRLADQVRAFVEAGYAK
jgi:hypothetical protein